MKKSLTIEAIHGLYAGEMAYAMSRIDSIDERVKAQMDSDDMSESAPYQVMDGIAVYRINGPLLSTGNFITKWLGYTSYEDVRNDMIMMANDPEVKEILTLAASPGGSVFGISDAAEAIRKVATTKPVYVYSSKNVASGMYWLASNATKLIGSPESEWGSIGVIVSHYSYEKQLEQEGIKVTVIKSDELKAVGGPTHDLTDREIEHIQEQVDVYADLFKTQIATTRPQVKLRQMKAQTFIGDEAKQMGLIDAVMSYDQTIDYIKSQRKPITQVGGYNMKLTAETLKVALDAGKTLEDLGITQEEMEAIMATDVTAEPGESAVDGEGQQDPGVVEPDAEGEGLDASAEMKLVIEQQQIEITTLIEQKSQLEAAAKEMKEIVIGVLNNRRIALGLTKLDMEAFSLPSILADYKAVSAEFDKSFKTGGVFKQKPEETKTVSVATDRAHAGLLQAAA